MTPTSQHCGKVRLANGQPAYTRGGYVSQAMIDRFGSYTAARQIARYRTERENAQ